VSPSPRGKEGYGQGVYRRRIALAGEGGAVRADLEDDFHRFGLWLTHDGERVTALEAEAGRFPWTTCPEATAALRVLEGTPLSTRCTDVARHADPKAQCTHLFDLAGLAVAHAARRGGQLRYDATLPDRRGQRTVALLETDGSPVLRWELDGVRITGPDPWTGQTVMGGGFLRFCREQSEASLLEPAFVLWRACAISWGRAFDIGGAPGAGSFASLAGGNCFSFQPGVVERARRQGSTILDFTDRPADLLRGKP
jgi:hypothetical protein